ncbi:MAG: extracellular solute-binding protein [Oscillospiraceae bacterium]|nr:extracellular solute-binding protein [Oscillospiraceae bacterium]
MKKLLVLILVLALAFVVIACDNDNGNGDGEITGSVEDGGTITVWCWDPAFNIFAMDQAAIIYQAINPNFEIEIIETPWEQVDEQITTFATAGTLDLLPDIMLVQDQAFQLNVMNFPEVFLDLTDSGINFSEFGAAKTSLSTVNGRNYGVPFDNGVTIMGLRTDVIGQAGLTIDDFTSVTWNDFITLGQQVLEATGRPMLATTAGGADYVDFMIKSAGVSMFNADGSPNLDNNPTLREAIAIYVELVQTGVLVEVDGWDAFIGSFVNDVVAGTIAGCWILGSIQQNPDHEGLWAVTNVPRLNVAGGTNFSSWGGSSWAVTTNANAALAIDFLKHTFAGSVELYDILLPEAGALATWIPAAASTVYQEEHTFFGGQRVAADIINFSANIPTFYFGIFHYEGISALEVAITNILNGADIDAELQAAQEFIEFQMRG